MKRAGEYGIILSLAAFKIATWANQRAVESMVRLHSDQRVQCPNQEEIYISFMISYPMTFWRMRDMLTTTVLTARMVANSAQPRTKSNLCTLQSK